jgi:ATP-binding cassette, subfamily B, multidrug efflux pump
MFDRHVQLLGVEVTKVRDVRQTLRRFWDYFGRHTAILLTVAVMVIAGTVMQVAVPVLIGQAVDCYLAPATLAPAGEVGEASVRNCWYTAVQPEATGGELAAGLGRLMLLIIALFAGSAVAAGLQFYLMMYAGQYALHAIRRDIFQHIHRLTVGYFTRHEAGDVMSRLTNDTGTIQQVLGFGLVAVIQGVLLIALIVVAMFSSSIPYALISLATLPLMFLMTRWFSGQARKAFRQVRREIGSVNANLQENIAAVREVQAFSREAENLEQFRQNNAANRDASIKAQAYTSALAPTLEALSYVSLAIVAGVGGYFILSGQQMLGATVSLGLIVTFLGYVQQFNRPVQQVAVLWTNIQSAVAGGERIFDFLDEIPDLTDKPGAIELPATDGHVRFEQVWAEYNPGEPVLKGIDLEAEPGETVAIVGPTGAGKTTIINLIPRFYDVTAGRVTLDGHDVRDVSRRSLRSQIGLVLQDTFLFSDTIMNNIRYGRPDAGDAEILAAAQVARADEFISRLPDGYETVLGERGSGLSQGQRQLLAIARVALAAPRILILDEATSSVDTRTERLIQAALETLLRGRTSFVIAHRLSTIRNADQVLVLRDGQIVERGRHEELLAARGDYYDLYVSQFRRQASDGAQEAVEDVVIGL